MKHFTGTFSIASGNYRCMKVIEPCVVKVLMYGKRHNVPYPEDSPEGVGPETQMSVLPQEFHRVTLLLKRIGICITLAVDLYKRSVDLDILPPSLRLHQPARNSDARTCGDILKKILIKGTGIGHYLNIINGRSVVQCNKYNIPVSPLGPHPALDQHIFPQRGFSQQFLNFYSFYHKALTSIMITLQK